MRGRGSTIYKGILRSNLKDADLKPRILTPEQILSLRYECALESKDFETAKALKALMNPPEKKEASSKEPLSEARQQAEQLFSKIIKNI